MAHNTIDADRLKAEINNRLMAVDIEKLGNFGSHRVWAYNDVKDLINSLQQEQPKPSGYDKALLEIKSKVDDLYEEASIGLNEYDSGLYNGIAETCMKLRGFIKSRLSSQEQPKMNIPSAGSGAMGTTPPKFKLDVKQDLPADLEKEIQEYLEKLGGGHGGFVDDLTDDDLTGFAHHFYELGQREMRHRIMNPEYNAKVVERLKSEYPTIKIKEE